MHRIGRTLAGASLTAVALSLVHSPSFAAPPPGQHARCDPRTNVCTVIAVRPSGKGNRTSRSNEVSRNTSRNAATQPAESCRTRPAIPQPPKSDPVWNGHLTGVIQVHPCWLLPQMDAHPLWAPTAPDTPANAVVSSAQLARQALAQLRIPRPVLHRSPDAATTDAGTPVTWVNMWTWVWTEPVSWRQLSKTASVGAVWATVTVKPTAMVFHPGVSGARVSCPGPGRPWKPADGDARPTGGGCGFVYRSVSSGVTASLAIRWTVSWTGSGGSSGQLPLMTTQVSDRFAVEQIQVVNR
jgi:hypothetical protein